MAEYNESQIQSNETQRIAQETERINNEARRNTNETERQAREQTRIDNEASRVTEFQAMMRLADVNAEDLLAGEQERIEAEQARIEAENIRAEFYEGFNNELREINSQFEHNKTYVTVEEFGAKGDGETDDTNAFIQAITSNKTIKLKKGKIYKLTDTLYLNSDLIGEDSTLMFYGSFDKMISQNKELSIRGVTLDGSNTNDCQYGLYVDTDFENVNTCYYDMTIKNISNNDNTKCSIGALFYKSSSASFLKNNFDIKINVDNLHSTQNSVIGDTGGATKGIYVSFLKNDCELKCKIHDSLISNLETDEDSDGVSIYLYDTANKHNKSNILIENCIVTDSHKRSFKIQAPNVCLRNCNSYGQTTIGFDVYGDNCIIDSCTHNAYGIGFWIRNDGATLKDCNVLSKDTFQSLRLSDNANNTRITNFNIHSKVDLLENTILVHLQNVNNCYIDKLIIKNENGLGIGVLVEGECANNTFINTVIDRVSIGYNLNYSSGNITLINNFIDVNKYGIGRSGNTSQYIKLVNSEIKANEVAMFCRGTNIEAICIINNCEINTNKNGLLVGELSEIYNTSIKSSNSSEGFGIAGKNIVVKNCRTFGFNYGLEYNYSTEAEITNNSIINSTLGILKTGVTDYIEYNNIVK